ncbi:26S proteasome non-ATPase regulatory subunit 14 homolog isoform X2 [Quercus lobata]|uniref:26S proteasome non-ATPase regulatory subunit 14 homolog isoform X2 n=1 Tax=Quercus lobata TaxID=97700 RepID=UPI001248EF98|nr:26S proteasome non-ATPase regulatory subunit 14 homolog isoform X2 [Quercus lobata]
MSGMERLQRMFAGAGGGLGHPPPNSPTLDSSEQIFISSLALLKMLKHGRAGVPMEVMGLMLGEFVDEYTVRVVDGLRCRRVVRALVLKLSITYSRLTCSICLNRLDETGW